MGRWFEQASRHNRHNRTWGTAIQTGCVVALLTPFLSGQTLHAWAHGSEPAGKYTKVKQDAQEGGNSERRTLMQGYLTKALEKLNDSELNAQLPVLQAIMERVADDPTNLNMQEAELARTLMDAATRAELDLSALRAKARQSLTNAKNAKPQVKTGENKTPAGRTGKINASASGNKIGYVRLVVGNRASVIAEIPSVAGNITPGERARQVAERIDQAAQKNPLWYLTTKPGQRNGAWVVLCEAAPDGYLLTCDAQFAQLRQTTPSQLANRVARRIRLTVGGANPALASRGGPSGQDNEDKASEARVAGDEAYASGNFAQAAKCYKEAIGILPNYLTAHERLCALYAETGDTPKLSAAVNAALAVPEITDEQRTAFRAYLP